jgi:hypothetical protein
MSDNFVNLERSIHSRSGLGLQNAQQSMAGGNANGYGKMVDVAGQGVGRQIAPTQMVLDEQERDLHSLLEALTGLRERLQWTCRPSEPTPGPVGGMKGVTSVSALIERIHANTGLVSSALRVVHDLHERLDI